MQASRQALRQAGMQVGSSMSKQACTGRDMQAGKCLASRRAGRQAGREGAMVVKAWVSCEGC